MEGDGSYDFLIEQKWKEADSSILANYLPPHPEAVITIVDENGRVFDLVPRRPKLELEDDTHEHSSYIPPLCLCPLIQPLTFSDLSLLFGDKEMRILMVGLKGAGKTTMLDKFHSLGLGDIVTTTPTLGFKVETLEYKNTSFTVWDLEGDDKVRALWRHYYHNIQGIIFVLDSSDHSRFDEARDELHRILNEDELKDAALLVISNKYDQWSSILEYYVGDKLDLYSLGQRKWSIVTNRAFDGEEIYRGLCFLSENIANEVNYCRLKLASLVVLNRGWMNTRLNCACLSEGFKYFL